MMRTRLLLALCLIACPSLASASDLKAIESALKKMKSKYLVVRNACSESSLVFDDQGRLLSKGTAAPASLNGVLQVDAVKLTDNEIEVKGDRLALFLDRRTRKIQGLKFGERIKIRIMLAQPPRSLADVEQVLGAVFYDKTFLESLQSGYWKDISQDDKQRDAARLAGEPIGILLGERPVYLVSPGIVTPPSTTYAPDPEYSEEARQKKISGTSVWTIYLNELGRPELIELGTSLEHSLDLRAVDTLRNWRFKPATRNGVPVAVKLNIEFSYSIF